MLPCLSLFSMHFILCLAYDADHMKFCTGLKMTSRTVGTLETFESEDKLFTKHILDEGHGDSTPNEGSVCMVNIMVVGKCFYCMCSSFLILTKLKKDCARNDLVYNPGGV